MTKITAKFSGRFLLIHSREVTEEKVFTDYHRVPCHQDRFKVKVGPLQEINDLLPHYPPCHPGLGCDEEGLAIGAKAGAISRRGRRHLQRRQDRHQDQRRQNHRHPGRQTRPHRGRRRQSHRQIRPRRGARRLAAARQQGHPG